MPLYLIFLVVLEKGGENGTAAGHEQQISFISNMSSNTVRKYNKNNQTIIYLWYVCVGWVRSGKKCFAVIEMVQKLLQTSFRDEATCFFHGHGQFLELF